MRVIAGVFKSRRLKGTPPGGIRPTSDKLRETLFNVLGPSIEGSIFFDGYAGMGGIGIEAISRGAELVYFVDQSRKACAIIRENLRDLSVDRGFRIIETDLAKALDVCDREGTKFDLAFLDPPYQSRDLYAASLEAFGNRPLLKDDGILIVEHSKRVDLAEVAGFLKRYRSLTHGDSTLSFYRLSRPPSPPDTGGVAAAGGRGGQE
jgi:16S rRNA (guanine966-N2)-methyltransferase